MGYSSLRMLKTYLELNRLIRTLGTWIGDDALFMVVSNHGMEPSGEHNDRAFHSFNKDIFWRPSKTTDYYYFVSNVLKKK